MTEEKEILDKQVFLMKTKHVEDWEQNACQYLDRIEELTRLIRKAVTTKNDRKLRQYAVEIEKSSLGLGYAILKIHIFFDKKKSVSEKTDK